MRAARNLPTDNDSDLVVAIFRTAFIVIITFVPGFLMQAGHNANLQISLVLAGIYNLVLLIAYWRGFHFPYQRQVTISIDLLLISLWVFYAGPLGVRFFPLYYITVIVAGFWFGVVGTIASAAVAGLLYLGALSLISPQAAANRLIYTALYEQIPFLFLVALAVSYVADSQAKERRGWYEARVFLARHQERVRLGQRIYDILQPGAPPNFPGLDLGVRFRPAGHAGAGDYYEIIPFGTNVVGLAMADVAGKMEPGLVKLPLFKAALRVSIRTAPSPGLLLSEINRIVYPDLQPEMFVALIYARFDLEQMNLTCAVAGMEPPFFIRGAGRQVAEIEASGMVLGVLPEVAYEETPLALRPGDTIVFFTDGTVEAQNQQGEEFGSARLREAAAAADARDLSAQGLADRLMELILSFSTTFGRKDDMTILVAKVLEK